MELRDKIRQIEKEIDDVRTLLWVASETRNPRQVFRLTRELDRKIRVVRAWRRQLHTEAA